MPFVTNSVGSLNKPGAQSRYFGYEVRGDGAMHRRYYDERGYHSAQQMRTADDVGLATSAFEQIKQSII